MKLAVAIVSYNTRDLLDRCLESVVGAVNGLEAEIIVVDNDSPDCSADFSSCAMAVRNRKRKYCHG